MWKLLIRTRELTKESRIFACCEDKYGRTAVDKKTTKTNKHTANKSNTNMMLLALLVVFKTRTDEIIFAAILPPIPALEVNKMLSLFL